MAGYPTFGQTKGSTEEWLDDVQIDRAANGTPRLRSFYTFKKKRFNLRHVLNATDVATLQTFYDSYRLVQNSLTWQRDGLIYLVYFDGVPSITSVGGGWHEVEVRLTQ